LRLGLWTLEERRNRCDLLEVFKMFYGYTGFYSRLTVMIRVCVAIVRKFVNQDLIQILGNIFFSNRVIDRWNRLDRDTVDAPSLNCFKNTLNKIRCIRMGFFMDWSTKP